jgi:DNA-binding NarL/FixJ family response regulator
MQILALIAFGMRVDEIAQQLDVPTSEVSAAMTSDFDKLKRSQGLRGPHQQLPQSIEG